VAYFDKKYVTFKKRCGTTLPTLRRSGTSIYSNGPNIHNVALHIRLCTKRKIGKHYISVPPPLFKLLERRKQF
jgi:hypothetical protein